ncbi:hypothetical protein Ddye_005321 [Dipteronia dyeriana]|uniref:AP2/ERF domain-containing protein n=1 Tax=Dipteronia dyeriana TaxID=168575 RepID=A0AAD9XG86_9ROSI|nr:hypothetical protein Ddye_005321 [Dipteronia dyeriana]
MESQVIENHGSVNPSSYRGIRKRKWGKWVSEIRQPGTKTRIWLGSYETPEMAAAAYDAAAFHIRGRGAQLNFSELAGSLPRPASSSAEDVQMAAQQAALSFRKPVLQMSDPGLNAGPLRVGLSQSQIQAINESPLDSPKMWMTELMAGTVFSGEEAFFPDNFVWEETQVDSIWD